MLIPELFKQLKFHITVSIFLSFIKSFYAWSRLLKFFFYILQFLCVELDASSLELFCVEPDVPSLKLFYALSLELFYII